MSRGPAAALQTPVDLHNYTAHLTARAVETAEQPLAQAAGHAAPHAAPAPQLTLNRRPALDLSLPLNTPRPAANDANSASDLSLDLSSPLDVPAFLRRQS